MILTGIDLTVADLDGNTIMDWPVELLGCHLRVALSQRSQGYGQAKGTVLKKGNITRVIVNINDNKGIFIGSLKRDHVRENNSDDDLFCRQFASDLSQQIPELQ